MKQRRPNFDSYSKYILLTALRSTIWFVFWFAFCAAGLATLPTAQAQSAETYSMAKMTGKISVWSREYCAPKEVDCPLPKRIGDEWPLVEIEYRRPTAEAIAQATGGGDRRTVLLFDRHFNEKNWDVQIIQRLVIPGRNQVPFVVTETKLRETLMGIIAECTRYDGVDAFRILPPGSCAGRNLRATYGVSFESP